MTFPYIALPPLPTGEFRWMPYVEVAVFGENDYRKGMALVDSGAEYCLINIQYAKKLGVALDDARTINFYGVAGTSEQRGAYIAEIGIQIPGMERTEIVAGFIDSDSVDIILGQINFFDRYTVTFAKNRNTFEITETA